MSTKKMQIIGLKGKSAYQYAQDGGYTGTEAEFKNKMAKELDVVYDYENLNEAILATAIKPEVSGEFIHITDSAALPIMNFGMEGKTEQKTTSGKNLWNNEYAKDRNNWDETIIAGGYTTMPIYVGIGTIVSMSLKNKLDAGISFLLGYAINLPNMGQLVYDNTNTYSKTTTSNDGYIYIGVNANGFDNFITYANDILQVEISDTPTEFEPYTGGQPSPNPDYPQEIINAGTYNEVTGRYEIGCMFTGKNLVDETAWNVGYENNGVIGTGLTHNNGSIGRYQVIEIPRNTDIYIETLSKDGVSKLRFIYALADENNNVTFYNNDSSPNTWSRLNVNSSNACKLSISILDVLPENADIRVNLASNSDFDGYYQSTEFTLTSPVPLTKWDKLVKRDGVYGWSILSKECEITGSESFSGAGDLYYAGSSTNMFHAQTDMTSLAGISIDRRYIYCNELSFVPSIWSKTDGTVGLNTNGNTQIHMRLPNTLLGVSDDATVTEKQTAYRNYLRQRHAAGNPLKLLYKVDTEQSFHPLPDSEQALLRSLETYYQVTNIYNDQNCPMSIQYIADTQTYVDNLTMSLTNAVVSLGGEV